MGHRSEVRKAELAIIDKARQLVDAGPPGIPRIWLGLADDVRHLNRLGLVKPGAAKSSRGAPLTSENAAKFMRADNAGAVAAMIVNTLYWTGGATVEMLEKHLYRKHQTVSARVNELRDLGWIEAIGTRLNDSGVKAEVYALTARARRMCDESTA